MDSIPHIPETAPFTAEQRAWLNGFLAGAFGQQQVATPALEESSRGSVLFLFGSQSGNSETLAKQFSKKAKSAGFKSRVSGLDQVSPGDLVNEQHALIVTSTWGEGEMPDNAKDFWDTLVQDSAPKFENLNYSVLALGDTNYETFCVAGKEFDRRFSELGANRLHPCVECDVEYEEKAEEWFSGVLGSLDEIAPTNGTIGGTLPNGATESPEPSAKTGGYGKKNPFPSPLLKVDALNGEGSAKDVRHIEFSLEGSGLEYETGDALGVFALNDEKLVKAFIEKLGVDPQESVLTPDDEQVPLEEALTQNYEITKITPKLLKLIAEKSGSEGLKELLEKENKAKLNDYLWGRDPLDLFDEYGANGITAPEFLETLRKLNPRLYSIASSPKAHPGEVHLTVGAVRYEFAGRERGGVCSTFMADRLPVDSTAGVFVQVSHGFRLPEDKNLPVIMVGPGTGIAPFRAFLEERKATEASGKNWLFFGDQHEATDFLYREELEGYVESGLIQHLHTAFSRDQEEKVYVQDRMREHGAELWRWISEGAHFYVCGDASRMAKDVDAVLIELVSQHGGKSMDEAKDFVAQLKKDKRYQRDVY